MPKIVLQDGKPVLIPDAKEAALDGISGLLVTMGFLILGVIELALSIVPLAVLAYILAVLCSRIKYSSYVPEKKLVLGLFGGLAVGHLFVSVVLYFPHEGRVTWWWVLLTSVMGFWAAAVGVTVAAFILVGLWKVVGRVVDRKEREYVAVASADECELEEGSEVHGKVEMTA